LLEEFEEILVVDYHGKLPGVHFDEESVGVPSPPCRCTLVL